MGTIKLEFDIPEFEKELKIEIILSKDGEVVYNTTSSPSTGTNKEEKKLSRKNKELVDKFDLEKTTSTENNITNNQEVDVKPVKKKKFGGNMMDLEI